MQQHHITYAIAVLAGALSGCLTYFASMGQNALGLWVTEQFNGMGLRSDSFWGLSIVAGLAFAALGGAFGMWRLRLPVLWAIAFCAASVGGMALAQIAAIVSVDGLSSITPFFYGRALTVGSLVGATALLAVNLWVVPRRAWGRLTLLSLLLPTAFATLLGLTTAPLEEPGMAWLFMTWQASTLLALAIARDI